MELSGIIPELHGIIPHISTALPPSDPQCASPGLRVFFQRTY